MAGIAGRYCLIGFSTGGGLALLSAAARGSGLEGVVAVSVPMIFRNKNMRFVPLMHGANRLLRSISPADGVMPFRSNQSEHPHINYYQMPIRGLYELGLLVDELRSRIPEVRCPVLLMQGDADPVVDPASVSVLCDLLDAADVEVKEVASTRHGIAYENIDGTQEAILDFVARLDASARVS
jgi:alpha-beta hydrolase superfamily lysophospholipase